MSEPVLIREHENDYGLVVDSDGKILHNAFQMDDPVIVRDYDDGLRHLFSKQTGKLIVAPFKPAEVQRVRCPHCNGELGGTVGGEG
jgi:hypothetical protein